MIRILVGDCRDVMAVMEPNSVDAIVTDPPYGLEFMGKEWDRLDGGLPQENVWKGRRGKGGSSIGDDDSNPSSRHHVSLGGKRSQFKRCAICGKRQFSETPCQCEAPEWIIEYPNGAPSAMIRMQRWHEAWAREAYRVLKPGGYLLAFGGTRTHHRLTVAIEDAGFEIRDCLMWLYGSGFPKSLDVSKALDKAAGAEREVVGTLADVHERYATPRKSIHGGGTGTEDAPPLTAPATDLARQWDGWGTALKPAWEPIVMARKPLIGSVAANVTQYGTGGLNIDATRIATDWANDPTKRGWQGGNSKTVGVTGNFGCVGDRVSQANDAGRWPPNVILDQTAAAALDAMSGERGGGFGRHGTKGVLPDSSTCGKPGGFGMLGTGEVVGYGDSGGASRFMKVVQPDCWLCDGPKYGIMNATKERSTPCEPANFADVNSNPNKGKNDFAASLVQQRRLLESEDRSGALSSLAPIAESSLKPTPETIESIAASNVQDSQIELLAHRVSDAGDLCKRCATAIAQSLASLSLNHAPSVRGLVSIDAHRWQILNRSLVMFAESLGNTDTIPTTTSLNLLFGYVRHAIATSIPTSETGSESGQTMRLFYGAKASRSERNKGLEGMPERANGLHDDDYREPGERKANYTAPMPSANIHPTVKPLDLMQWLCRLVTPPGGTILDPFGGSGSTMVAADREGFHGIYIDTDPEYAEIARRRVYGDAPLFAQVDAE